MAGLNRLDNLYPTMTDLAAYLMIAHEKHPRYILSTLEKQPNGATEEQVRITYEYVQALLACGIPLDSDHVRHAVSWFGTRFSNTLNRVELLRLEALLYLDPAHPGVQPRLQSLIQHQLDNGLFEVEGSVVADTLAALRVFMLARQRQVLQGRPVDTEIEQIIDRIRDMLSESKDRALLLRYKHQLTGKLDSSLLKQLLDQAREHGIWGIRRKHVSPGMKNIIEAMRKRQLFSAAVGDQSGALSEIILDNCAVIEHLSQIASDLKSAREVLESAMTMWWNQLQGDQSPVRLRALLPDETTYLHLLCWTVLAVHAYTGEPLGQHLLVHALGAAAGRFKEVEWAEKADIETALRQWIGVDLPDHPDKLKLGLSDSNVVRIAPRLFHPLTAREMNAPGETLIVKYGPIEEVDEERAKYNALSETMQRFFVEIPNRTYINDNRQAFVIMEDLVGYFTLYEVFKDLLLQDDSHLARQLSDFLTEMHSGGDSGGIGTSVHFHDLYIRPMLEHVDFIFARVLDLQRSGLMPQDATFQNHEVIYDNLSELLATILQRQRVIERFPTAFMHGDLHSRNIMIRWDQTARRPTDRFEFKLIDLSRLRPDGDVAHDAGQILVDLETLPLRDDFTDHTGALSERLDDLLKKMERNYTRYAFDRIGDDTFSIRLDLARARARIRIAKSRARQGGKHLSLQAHNDAVELIRESLQFAEWAAYDLEAVCQEIVS